MPSVSVTSYSTHVLAVLAKRRFERAYQSRRLLKWSNSPYESGDVGMVLAQIFTRGSGCPCASGSRRIRFFRSATSVATTAVLAEEMSARNRTAIPLDFRNPRADENSALKCVCRLYIPSYARSPLRGFSGAQRHSVFCFALRPLRGLGSSQNNFAKCSKERSANLFWVPPRKQTFGTWEPGPLASFAQRDPSNNGRIQKTETLSCIRTK
jgi:hypothetical protein